MSIFAQRNSGNQTTVLENMSFTDEQLDRVDHSLTGINEILTEAAEVDYKIEAGMYISDVVIENAVTLEGAQPEVLLENFAKKVWEKIVDAFKTLWKKIKEWYAAVVRWFKITFATGDKLIKDFKKEILSKPVGEFSYEGYKFDFNAGSALAGKVISDGKAFLSQNANVIVGAADEEIASNQMDRGEITETDDELRDKLIDGVFGGSISDTVEKVREAFFGKDGKEEIEKFSAGPNRDAMVKLVEDKSKLLKTAEDAAKTMDGEFKRVLTAIERAQKLISDNRELNETEKSRLTAIANKRINIAKSCLSGLQQVNGIEVDAIKSAYTQYVRVLKSFLRYKPAKEGFADIDDTHVDNQSTSLFESAMRWV